MQNSFAPHSADAPQSAVLSHASSLIGSHTDPAAAIKDLSTRDQNLRTLEIKFIKACPKFVNLDLDNPHKFEINDPRYWVADHNFRQILDAAKTEAAKMVSDRNINGNEDFIQKAAEVEKEDTAYWNHFHAMERLDPSWHQASQTFLSAYECLQDLITHDLAAGHGATEAIRDGSKSRPFEGYTPALATQMMEAIEQLLEKSNFASDNMKKKIFNAKTDWSELVHPSAAETVELADARIRHKRLQSFFIDLTSFAARPRRAKSFQDAQRNSLAQPTLLDESFGTPAIYSPPKARCSPPKARYSPPENFLPISERGEGDVPEHWLPPMGEKDLDQADPAEPV